jgi:hypothetical protein
MNRIDKARARVALNDVKPINHDAKGRITNAHVSGSHATIYQVIIRRKNGTIETECQKDVGIQGHVPCKGGTRAVCYHALAVLLQSAVSLELNASICEDEGNAVTLNKIHKGELYKVISKFKRGNPVWFVTYPQKRRKETSYGVA